MVTRLTLPGGGCGDKANFARWGGCGDKANFARWGVW